MKINLVQLEQQLHKPFATFYWLAGDEPLLLQQAADAIRKKARAEQIDERLRFDIDAHFNWPQLITESQTLSLFATRRLLELHLNKTSINAEIGHQLAELLYKKAEEDVILLTSARVDARILQSAWFKKLEPKVVFVPIWPIEYKQLPHWIEQQAKRYQLSTTPEARCLLANRYENNLLAINQVLMRYYYSAQYAQSHEPITEEWIGDNTLADARYILFDLPEACLSAQHQRIHRILLFLQHEINEPTLVLWSITREIRFLLSLHLFCQQGQSFSAAAQQLRLPIKRQSLYQMAYRRVTVKQLEQMLKFSQRIDNALKGAITLPIWPALQDLCFLCAGLQSSVLYYSGISAEAKHNYVLD